jgi:hypothetical protein
MLENLMLLVERQFYIALIQLRCVLVWGEPRPLNDRRFSVADS